MLIVGCITDSMGIIQEQNVNGGVLKFINKICDCGMRAAVKISESSNNPQRLYYCCPKFKDKCTFYR